MRGAGPGRGAGGSPALEWIAGLLWPSGGVRVGGRRTVRSDEVAWWVVPSAGSPRILVPVDGPAAAAALRQFNDSMPARSRIAKAALGAGLRFGAGRLGRLERFSVPGDAAGEVVGGLLPRLFDTPSVVVSITLGRELRPNLKPVLQAMTHEGEVLGYAKIGWNDTTRALLANEAAALRRWEGSPPSSFRVPRVLYHGACGELTVLVTTPVPHAIRRSRRLDRAASPCVLRELAAHGGMRSGAPDSSAFVASLPRRLLAAGIAPDAVRPAIERVESHRGPVTLGTWHGDWAPWNMATTDGTLHVWDWERSADDVPIGLDAFHFGFEVALHKGSASPSSALAAGAERAGAALASLGVDADPELLRTMYVLERLARLAEGRADGVAVDDRLLRALTDAGARP